MTPIIATGRMIKVPAADASPQLKSRLLIISAIAVGAVDAFFEVKIIAKKNSFQAEVNVRILTDAREGTDIGRMTLTNVDNALLPSIAAASSSSLGMDL